ncbi:unnamed protein product [Leptidea sinapis]|uniref:Fibronectin type-III domain-containing protein n=1 Tax=Leptidea sinapis TaxID=189913 RepID=A0A5E4R1K3_9NEOP|nr:unnamed protein product [Leptidea sinapis]
MPQDVKVDAFDKHTLRVTWKPPPPQDWNGELQGYYVGYKLASSNKSYVFETVDISKESGKEHHLDILNLKTYTQYAIVVQAFNKMGSGPVSNEVRAYTAEGAPSAPPQDVLCTTLTAQTIRVSWVSPPLAAANGLIKAYKVIYGPSETWYAAKPFSMDSRSLPITLWKCWRPPTEETDPSCRESPSYGRGLHLSVMAAARAAQWRRDALQRVHSGTKRRATSQQASQTSYSATELKAGRYDFWVTASTIIGEGQPSATASCSPSDKVPAKIASFDESFTATYKEDVKLPCLAVGVPQPNILLQNESANCRKVHCRSLVWRERTQGSTLVTLRTSSERTPSLTRSPPFPPQLSIASSSVSSLTLRLKPPVDADQSSAAGYTIHYKQEFGDWETVQDSILVSWRPPAQPNGVVTHYNVYTQAQNAEPHPNKVPASQTSYSATELKAGRYDFWVTASTIIGEGQPSATASCSPSDKVPAKIASFDESFTATYKEDVKLPCLAVGVPQPNILLQNESANCRKVHCRSLVWRERTQGSTLVTLRTSSERTPSLTRCHATLPSATEHRVFICFISHAATQAPRRRRPVLGRRLHHPLQTGIRRLGNCTDINSIIGTGEASDVVIARTRGSKPPVPRAADFIEVGSSSVTLHLKQWLDGGCPMSHFVVENKKKGAAEWNQISNAVKPGGNFVVLASHMVRAADHRSQ